MKKIVLLFLSFVCSGLHADWKLQLDMKIPLPGNVSPYSGRLICWSNDGKTVYTNPTPESLGVIDIRRGLITTIHRSDHSGSPLLDVAVAQDGSGIISSTWDKITIWNIAARSSRTFDVADYTGTYCALGSDGYGCTIGWDGGGYGRLYAFKDETVLHGEKLSPAPAGVAASPDGTMFAVTNALVPAYFMKIWDVHKQAFTQTCSTPNGLTASMTRPKWKEDGVFVLGRDSTLNYLVHCTHYQTTPIITQFGIQDISQFDVNGSYVVATASAADSTECIIYARNDLQNELCHIAINASVKGRSGLAFNPKNDKQFAIGADDGMYVYSLVYSDGPEDQQHAILAQHPMDPSVLLPGIEHVPPAPLHGYSEKTDESNEVLKAIYVRLYGQVMDH